MSVHYLEIISPDVDALVALYEAVHELSFGEPDVDDIRAAVKQAEEKGAVVAYPPTHQGRQGTFAILIQAGVQHGLWQR